MALHVDVVCPPLEFFGVWEAVFYIVINASTYYNFFCVSKVYRLNFSKCDIAVIHMENDKIWCYLQ